MPYRRFYRDPYLLLVLLDIWEVHWFSGSVHLISGENWWIRSCTCEIKCHLQNEKIGWICPSGIHSSETCLSKQGALSVSMEIEGIKCFWSTFEREATPSKREKKTQQDEMESWIVCPHHLPLKWLIPFLLISSHTCKMTSESCLCLYLPLPSDTGLYRESWSEQGKD